MAQATGNLLTQEPGADRVERTGDKAASPATEQGPQALAHLLRGFVGEGEREDLAGLGTVVVDQVGDAQGEHTRFAAAGTGSYEHGANRRGNGGALLGVERTEQVHNKQCGLPDTM
ncbi:MAG: hypothetical protein OHK0015_51870 [Chloroflexi bacterium OHK40]